MQSLKDVNLPNNRVFALKKLNCLQRKFLEDEHFYEIYKAFIADMVCKESRQWQIRKNMVHTTPWCCSSSKSRESPSSVWLFSAEYRGTSLNSQLISGPDLTNQLVGVLTRFREKQVAYIADVETMFHKVSVPKDQMSLLRFLWWQNGDIRNPIKDHEICVHLFGSISSPSCSDYMH